ncbi:hypothetical protein KM043_002952 [Ampulex compressa]|nr:hypothetical protein KM043_002952 [Ampulex compressa]
MRDAGCETPRRMRLPAAPVDEGRASRAARALAGRVFGRQPWPADSAALSHKGLGGKAGRYSASIILVASYPGLTFAQLSTSLELTGGASFDREGRRRQRA